MRFADLHHHALWGVDDGPASEQEMFQMVDAAYRDGVQVICLTPHYHPGYFSDNPEQVERSFASLKQYAAEKYPDLRLYPGNELRYSGDCLSWLESQACRTLNATDYVLVDFSENESERNIIKAIDRLMSAGYTPVLAHAERYRSLSAQHVLELSRNSVWIQVDVQSIFGTYGLGARLRSRALLKKKLVDVVASDAHDLGSRSPILSRGYRCIKRAYGEAYAAAVFWENPLRLLEGERQEGAISNHE